MFFCSSPATDGAHHRAFLLELLLHGVSCLFLSFSSAAFFCCNAWMRVVATRPSADSFAIRCRTTYATFAPWGNGFGAGGVGAGAGVVGAGAAGAGAAGAGFGACAAPAGACANDG